jgi:dolichyl-phosphate-mannose--protein O-mannosyl transferase
MFSLARRAGSSASYLWTVENCPALDKKYLSESGLIWDISMLTFFIEVKIFDFLRVTALLIPVPNKRPGSELAIEI